MPSVLRETGVSVLLATATSGWDVLAAWILAAILCFRGGLT